ncbi:MAG: hypothetical protein JXR79_09170 [Nitrospirae bacterium]|nr:hypothetical protein [Nitrospirota bacterium]
MKVKCIWPRRTIPEGKIIENNTAITLGKEYVVLDIAISVHGMEELLIQRDSDKIPAVFPMSMFEITDPRLPKSWIVRTTSGGRLRFEPPEFGGDFWDFYHDGDEATEKLFEEVAKRIEAESK